MRSFPLTLTGIALTSTLIFLGCTRTVVSGSSDSPDKKYRVYCRIAGEYGRPFLDETPKTAQISIVTADTTETLLFRKQYRVIGSDLAWDVAWDENHNVTVVLYDYGRGIYWEDGKRNGTATNHLGSFVYRINPKTGRFVDQPHGTKKARGPGEVTK
jgi:hypothetical protein